MFDFSILMSIKPRFTHEIFNTTNKDIELRKSIPLRYKESPFRVYVYESGSGYIIGHFMCDCIRDIKTIKRSALIKDLCYLACVTPQEFNAYNPSYAYWIYKRTLYTKPIPHKEFATQHGLSEKPPQSWCYVRK